MAVLAARGGVLLADEPGLGKSFVAAAIAAEWQSRGAAIDLVVPAGLVAQWCETLRDFGVSATVVTHDGIITAPFVAQPAVQRLVIVDEAHEFRNPRTQRYAALARRTVAARVLLVTATPVCNSARDLEALIALDGCATTSSPMPECRRSTRHSLGATWLRSRSLSRAS